MTTISVKDASETTQTIEMPPSPGRAAAAASRPVALSTEDKTSLDAVASALAAATPAGTNIIGKVGIDQTAGQNKVAIVDINDAEYETVAASATDQALGATGAAGDYLASVLIVPATTSPGAVSIKDGAGTSITIFAGGANSVATLHPFSVQLGIKSTSGPWKVTTGANVSAIGIGNFT